MSAGDDERAAEVVGACRERIERGERVDVEAIVREHPDLASRLARYLGGLRLLDRAYADAAVAAQRPSRAGQSIGPYRLVRELGAGGMGTVYLATAGEGAPGIAAGERVALKAMHPHLCARPGFLQRFLREAEIGRRVRHANVVRTLDAGEHAAGDERVPFLVMEYVEGRTLRTLLAELGRVPEELCRHVGREIAQALCAIHAEGAVHRDLKPDNVLITQDHVVKVMDLGVARVRDEELRLSQTGAFVGSLRYGAPEQFGGPAPRSATSEARSAKGGDEVDGRADLHALGLLLYELATGVHPLGGDDVRVVVRRLIEERPRRAGEVNPQLSPLFEELLSQLLAKDRDERPANAAEVVRILDEGEESAWWKARSQAMRRETRRPLRRIRIPRETSLYGRESELALLRSLFERASEGRGQVALIEGEAGIGKSRLVDEFALSLWAEGEDFDFLYGSYPPGGAATASGAFSTAYREHLGDDDAAVREALKEAPLLVPSFAALLKGDAAPEDAVQPTKASLQSAFVHATRSFAARRTTIVLIDDLHFAPEEGRALFAALALAIPGHRILLVGCMRPTIDEQWEAQIAARPQTTRLIVPRLGPKELVRLLRDALSSERLAEELSALIALKSDGNPFFVFELLRGLRDGQFLRQKPDGTWETTQIIRDIQVPSSIAELVQARVADFGAEDKDLLDVASCCGFEFDPLVAALALRRDRVAVLQSLGRIERRHRLVRAAGRRFVFDHHQVQEALYAGLSELLREEYHARIGEAIEASAGAAAKDADNVPGATCVELAEHLLKGAQGARALRYLDAAMTHLEKNYLNDAAVRIADRALAAPGLLAGTERCEMLLRKAGRLDVLGRREAERAALEEAVALAYAADDPARRARARRSLGEHLLFVSRYPEAEAMFGEALELARVAGDRKEAANAMGALGNVFIQLGRFADAKAHHERRLALAREIGDRRGEVGATGNLGSVFAELGSFAEAQAHHERCLALAREIGDRRGEGVATGNLGMLFFQLGRFAEAQAHLERRLVLAREIGDRRGEAAATMNLGGVYSDLGRFDEAQGQTERFLALVRELGEPRGEAVGLVNLGPLRLALGDRPGARRHLDAALALCREIGTRYPEGYALYGLAAVADEECDAAEAQRLAEEALALRREIGHGGGVAESLFRLADLRRRAGDEEGARAAAEEALALERGQGRKAEVASCLALLATLPGGDTNAAVEALAEAGESLIVARAAEVRFLLWQATGGGAHLTEAKRLLDFLVEHAPADCRESMLANVRLHREIVAAAREHGVA